MKKTIQQVLVATAVAAVLAGCGGAGGSSATSQPPATAPITPTPSTSGGATVQDPFTGASAGTATTTIAGQAYPGATVTAYAVQPDGSSGPMLTTPVISSNGVFTLNLATVPFGMVRVVASGGTILRLADGSLQHIDSLEVVTPYVTLGNSHFVITTVSDLAARIMAIKAKQGMKLPDAFKAGMRAVLQLDSANMLRLDDLNIYMNVLNGSIRSNGTYFAGESGDMHEIKNALDWFGVQLDMPTTDVQRVVAAAGAANYPQNNVDVNGGPINAGAWVNGRFDSSAPVTLNSLMFAKLPVDERAYDPQAKVMAAPTIPNLMNRYMILDFVIESACVFGTGVQLRYPWYELDSTGKVPLAECQATVDRLKRLRAVVNTNNSTKMK